MSDTPKRVIDLNAIQARADVAPHDDERLPEDEARQAIRDRQDLLEELEGLVTRSAEGTARLDEAEREGERLGAALGALTNYILEITSSAHEVDNHRLAILRGARVGIEEPMSIVRSVAVADLKHIIETAQEFGWEAAAKVMLHREVDGVDSRA